MSRSQERSLFGAIKIAYVWPVNRGKNFIIIW